MLRNSIYMHGLINQAARMVADGRAAIPPNESTIGYVTREDCARAAAAVLSTPGHENKAYDITGPELLGVRETAAVASAVTGKPIEVVQGGADVRPGFGRPAMSFTTSHFEDLTGRKPTSVRTLFEANKESAADAAPGASNKKTFIPAAEAPPAGVGGGDARQRQLKGPYLASQGIREKPGTGDRSMIGWPFGPYHRDGVGRPARRRTAGRHTGHAERRRSVDDLRGAANPPSVAGHRAARESLDHLLSPARACADR